MATNSPSRKELASLVREEDLHDLEELLKTLEDRAYKAGEDGRVYLMQQYTRMIAMISSEAERIRARFKRESLASLRREQKRLKEEQRPPEET